MSTVARLKDNVRIRLPGALDAAIDLELFNVIYEMCTSTYFYRERLSFTPVAGQQTYDVTQPSITVLWVFQAAHQTWDTSGVVFEAKDEELYFTKAPTAADVGTSLVYEAAVAPKEGSPAVPENWLPVNIFALVYPTLLDGVLYRMMTHPAKPYSNEKGAVFHGRKFRNAMSLLKASSNYPVAPSWRFPSGWK